MKAQQQSNPSGVEYVGIDVSQESLAVNAGALFAGTIENTPAAIGALVRGLRKRLEAGRELHFCLEHTGLYGQDVWFALANLAQTVCVLDPAKVRHYAKACGIAAKTDPIDAAVIRAYAEQTHPAPTPKPAPLQMKLRELTRCRGLYVRMRASIRQELAATHDPFCRDRLQRSVRELTAHIERLDREIADAIASDEGTKRICEGLESIRGVSNVTAALMVALVPELGTIGRNRAGSLAGLAPFPKDSGKKRGHRKTGMGRENLRQALFMPTFSAVRCNPKLKAFYDHLRNDLHKPYYVAMVAAMHKLFLHMNSVAAQVRKAAASGESGQGNTKPAPAREAL